MKELTIKPVPIPTGANHPEPPFDVLPKHEFSMGLIAPKGAGKTTLLVNLLDYYKGYFHSIFIFSPTVNNDEKWEYVKRQKYLEENTKLLKFMKKLARQKEMKEFKIVEPPPAQLIDGQTSTKVVQDLPNRKDGTFDPKIPEENFMTEYNHEDLMQIKDDQQQMIDMINANGGTKHIGNRILTIFDDLVGSQLFSNQRRNPFKTLNTNHRHLSTSILMVSQAYKEIPKTVRTNFTCLILFRIFSEAELLAIYQEYPMGMKKDAWFKVYEYCTDDEHSFLFYNIKQPKEMRIMKNFDEFVFMQ